MPRCRGGRHVGTMEIEPPRFAEHERGRNSCSRARPPSLTALSLRPLSLTALSLLSHSSLSHCSLIALSLFSLSLPSHSSLSLSLLSHCPLTPLSLFSLSLLSRCVPPLGGSCVDCCCIPSLYFLLSIKPLRTEHACDTSTSSLSAPSSLFHSPPRPSFHSDGLRTPSRAVRSKSLMAPTSA